MLFNSLQIFLHVDQLDDYTTFQPKKGSMVESLQIALRFLVFLIVL